MNKLQFAIPGALFFATASVLMCVYGGGAVRSLIIFALLVGGYGQFIAQDDRPEVVTFGLVLAYVAMLLGLIAAILFAV